jgi:hypothetical protein
MVWCLVKHKENFTFTFSYASVYSNLKSEGSVTILNSLFAQNKISATWLFKLVCHNWDRIIRGELY